MKYFVRTVTNGLDKDEVYIPRQVMNREDISDNAKLIYGMIFSECLDKMENFDEDTVIQAAKIISDFCKDVPMSTVKSTFLNFEEEAVKIRDELHSLSSASEAAEYLRECQVRFVRVQKPVCNFCSNGKMMYKLFDLINTLVYRMLDDTQGCETLSEDETEALKSYNENHNAELLGEVIDILKK